MGESNAGWRTPPKLWEKVKPLARQMRRKLTLAEERLWKSLCQQQVLGFKFRRQQAIDRFIVDFYCAKARLVIEVDGPIHDSTPIEDGIRQDFLESLGMRVIRFSNEEVLNSQEAVIVKIKDILQSSTDNFR